MLLHVAPKRLEVLEAFVAVVAGEQILHVPLPVDIVDVLGQVVASQKFLRANFASVAASVDVEVASELEVLLALGTVEAPHVRPLVALQLLLVAECRWTYLTLEIFLLLEYLKNLLGFIFGLALDAAVLLEVDRHLHHSHDFVVVELLVFDLNFLGDD